MARRLLIWRKYYSNHNISRYGNTDFDEINYQLKYTNISFMSFSELQDKVNGTSDVIQKELGVMVSGGSSSNSGTYNF